MLKNILYALLIGLGFQYHEVCSSDQILSLGKTSTSVGAVDQMLYSGANRAFKYGSLIIRSIVDNVVKSAKYGKKEFDCLSYDKQAKVIALGVAVPLAIYMGYKLCNSLENSQKYYQKQAKILKDAEYALAHINTELSEEERLKIVAAALQSRGYCVSLASCKGTLQKKLIITTDNVYHLAYRYDGYQLPRVLDFL